MAETTETTTFRLALAQLNPTVGAIDANVELAAAAVAEARDAGAQMVVLPELCISGYPPEDLLLRRDFLEACALGLENLASHAQGIVVMAGVPEAVDRAPVERDPVIDPITPPAWNSAAILADGKVLGVYRKMHLPNYGVFDERRYFEPGSMPAIVDVDGVPVGLSICEDLWVKGSPEAEEAAAGASLIVNSSASPYHRNKGQARERMLATRATENKCAVALCNTVGGQDELVFDGASVIIDASGKTLARAPQFTPGMIVADLELPMNEVAPSPEGVEVIGAVTTGAKPGSGPGSGSGGSQSPPPPESLPDSLDEQDEVWAALELGTRDYVEKNGFKRVVIALSGGIDSAIVAAIAVDALGRDRVTCVSMPSPYSSSGTKDDAREIARNLGVEFFELPILGAMNAYKEALGEAFRGLPQDVTEENLQARIRGTLVMALSNKFGWLVLTTGNKSEVAVGYATLYGDMVGGFNPVKDVLKTQIYKLVARRNEREGREVIPSSVLTRAPSAELRPDQEDQDSLPPYELLDRILEAYVEDDQGRDALIAEGFPQQTVDDVIKLVDRAEYKRRQAAPGIRVSTKSFGRDRRLPITNRYS